MKWFRGKAKMQEMENIIDNAADDVETELSQHTYGFWQTVVCHKDGTYSLATVPVTSMGDDTEGYIEPLSASQARKLIDGSPHPSRA